MSDVVIGRTNLRNESGVIGLNESGSNSGAAGVSGTGPIGVEGDGASSGDGIGVMGNGFTGVRGHHNGPAKADGFLAGLDPQFHQVAGVYGESTQQGVMGLTTVPKGTGVYGGGTTTAGGDQIGVRGETFSGVGVQGRSFGPAGLAGNFLGNVEVKGDVSVDGFLNVSGDVLLANRDISERFAVASLPECEPGMVMVVGEDGILTACACAYDRRVIGVISGAGPLRPAVTLGHGQHAGPDVGIALVGTAYCLVDAGHGEIGIGDLLTSAPTRGHAMRVADPVRSPGAVIGKALASLERGRGLIPIVVSLQ